MCSISLLANNVLYSLGWHLVKKDNSKFKTSKYWLNSFNNTQLAKHSECCYTPEDMTSQGGVPSRSDKAMDLNMV